MHPADVVIDGENFERRFFPKHWGRRTAVRLEDNSHRRSFKRGHHPVSVSRINGSLKLSARFTTARGLVDGLRSSGRRFNFFGHHQDKQLCAEPQRCGSFWGLLGSAYPDGPPTRAGVASQVLDAVVHWLDDGGRLRHCPNEESHARRVRFRAISLSFVRAFRPPDRRERGNHRSGWPSTGRALTQLVGYLFVAVVRCSQRE